MVVRGSGHLGDAQRRYPRWELSNSQLKELLELGVGGVILLGGSAAELALRCSLLRHWSGHRPLLLCADVEEGVGQRFEGASWLPPPLSLERLWRRGEHQAALTLAERYGSCTARQARAVGLNWLLAPVCDVNNNPANPVINVRAWGVEPNGSGALATAFTRGAQAKGVLCCAKHFPGHGDCDVDSHLDLPVLSHDRRRLAAVELPPFQAAIEARVASIMTAHIALPALDPEHPATLSRAVLHDLLREELGFRGLVITDALVMEAISARHGPGEAAVMAFSAGADVLLMPADAMAAIDALEQAFRSGRLAMEDLEASLLRHQQALDRLPPSLESDQVEPEALVALEQAEDGALRQDLLRHSLEGQGVRPLGDEPGLNLIRIDSALQCPPLQMGAPALSWPEGRGWHTAVIDGRGPSPWSGHPEHPLDDNRLPPGRILLQLFVRGNPFRGRQDGEGCWPAVVQQLQGQGRLDALIVYGSPYLWRELKAVLSRETRALYTPAQLPEAQSFCLGHLGWRPPDGRVGGFTD